MPTRPPLAAYNTLYGLLEKQAGKEAKSPTVPQLLIASETPTDPLHTKGTSYVAGSAKAAGAKAAITAPIYQRSRQQIKAENELADLSNATNLIETVKVMSSRLITARTPGEAMVQAGRLHLGAATGYNAEASAYQDSKGAFVGTLSRTLGGENGVLTQGDINRMAGIFPSFGDTAAIAQLNTGLLSNALETAIEAKQDLIEGKVDIATARKRVQARLKELFPSNTPPGVHSDLERVR
jgi:hypothetical protein